MFSQPVVRVLGIMAATGASAMAMTSFLRPKANMVGLEIVAMSDGHMNDHHCLRAHDHLAKDGAVILRGLSDTDDMIAFMQPMLVDNPLQYRTNGAQYRQSSFGRYHLSMMNTELEDVVRKKFISNPSWGRMLSSEQELSMIHLLDSVTGSASQIWHADNALGGLTVVVAMTDVTPEMGPTAMILESHHLNTVADYLEALMRPSLVSIPPLKRGDVLVYSSKLLHRGEANLSPVSRPVIVFRYDDPRLPAPGSGIVGAQFRALVGELLS